LQTAWLLLAALQLASLVLWARTGAVRTRASVPSAALSLLSSLAFCVLSYTEHRRATRPSSLLDSYLFATLLFDIAHARTLWLRAVESNGRAIAALAIASAVVKAVLLVLEAWEKRRMLRPNYRSYPPEATGSIYNRYFFWWLNPLFFQGFREVLVIDDLFTLDKKLGAACCYERFRTAWAAGWLS
jgi:hypothetical protein